MAVQAQYPSNLLPFCSRSDQEMKKTATGFAADSQVRQRQSPTGFLEQHHALFFPGVGSGPNNDISNNYSWKRARDTTEGGGGFLSPTATAALPPTCDHHATSAAIMTHGILAPTQPMMPPLLMTPSVLGGAGLTQLRPLLPQPQQKQQHEEVPISVVSTGLRLSLEDQTHMQQQQQRLHSSVQLPPISDELAAEIKQQKEEIDRFLLVQGEHLRRSIAESRRRQFRSLVSAAEESASRKLQEKQSELDRACRTRADLEARAARLAADSAAWQAKARAGEAAAAALRAQLDRAAADLAAQQHQHQQCGCGAAAAAADGARAIEPRAGSDDAASACVDPRREEMERQAAAAAAGSTSSRLPPGCRSPVACKQCGSAGASVLLLPCRHLCLCASCSKDAALPAVCPVCFCARSVAVEVFFC